MCIIEYRFWTEDFLKIEWCIAWPPFSFAWRVTLIAFFFAFLHWKLENPWKKCQKTYLVISKLGPAFEYKYVCWIWQGNCLIKLSHAVAWWIWQGPGMIKSWLYWVSWPKSDKRDSFTIFFTSWNFMKCFTMSCFWYF